jgi:uncharacterized protein YjdB
MRSFSRAVKAAVGTVGLVAALLGAVAAPANAEEPGLPDVGVSADPLLCFQGHVQDIGWQDWNCNNDGDWAGAGSVRQNLRLETLRVVAYNTGGRTCTQAHLQDTGWQREQCMLDGEVAQVGTIGESRRIEAIAFNNMVRSSCAEAHVQNYGWMGAKCVGARQPNVVGTRGEGLRLEAVTGTIL